MILLVEPISKNIGMYVPAYPLPIMEIGSFVKHIIPEVEIQIVSIPVDYGLPLTRGGKDEIYREFLQDLSKIKPKGIGISCTAIAQAEEAINLCELIKKHAPNIFIFLGGYFPSIYYEEIFARTSAVDLIVIGEGEITTLNIIESLEMGKTPKSEDIPNLAWQENEHIHLTGKGKRFDLSNKALINLELLRYPREYEFLPYAFSRGCPYQCNFCMEDLIRPVRKEVPEDIIHKDLISLSEKGNTHTILISDALFKSFNLFPFLRSLGMKINFETRCDVLDPALIPQIADVCGMLALGFESASYNTLKRMNKVKNRSHYKKYISNTRAIFNEAVKNNIPLMVFMIAGYPGDTEKDLEESLLFVKELSENSGPGGHVFKIGECHVYHKTRTYDLAYSLEGVEFDNDGVFGQNVVKQPSNNLNFDTILDYTSQIFNLSNQTHKLQETLLNMMPFFRLPGSSLMDSIIPDKCFRGTKREIFNVHTESIRDFRKIVPDLMIKYEDMVSGERSARSLQI